MKPLELQITSTNVQTGSVPVSWCVDRQVFKDLTDRGVKEPRLLIGARKVR